MALYLYIYLIIIIYNSLDTGIILKFSMIKNKHLYNDDIAENSIMKELNYQNFNDL